MQSRRPLPAELKVEKVIRLMVFHCMRETLVYVAARLGYATCFSRYICTHIHAYIHTCIHAYIHTYIHTYIVAYLFMHLHKQSCVAANGSVANLCLCWDDDDVDTFLTIKEICMRMHACVCV